MLDDRLILVNLLIKLGVAASAASILGRSVEFKSLLFREERTLEATNLPRTLARHSHGPGSVGSLRAEKLSGG